MSSPALSLTEGPAAVTVEVLGTPRSASARRIVELLRRNAVPYLWRNVEEDSAAHSVAQTHRQIPDHRPHLVVVADRVLVDPDESRVRDELGLPVESPAAAFRAFAAGATDTVVVGHGPAEDIIVTAHDSPDGAVCMSVHDGQIWLAVATTRLLALHRLVTRMRAGDPGFGADRGYGPTGPDTEKLHARADVFSATLAS